MWPGLIAKSKEGGADVIETYVFWSGHEPSRGQVMLFIHCDFCYTRYEGFEFSELVFSNTICFLISTILKKDMTLWSLWSWLVQMASIFFCALDLMSAQSGISGYFYRLFYLNWWHMNPWNWDNASNKLKFNFLKH